MVQSTSAGKPISFMFPWNVPPTARVFGPPRGKPVWVAFHAPYDGQSVNWAHTFSAGARMRASALTSAMRPPLRIGRTGLRCRGTQPRWREHPIPMNGQYRCGSVPSVRGIGLISSVPV
ncbi:hypothetical protein SHL15_1330 [Streptomyces hygroscopicus subsp. limoneus]|nr:hypothetical protein SHL15_1330 [Streptomyces hygroscopicus subsp. limoneus]